MNKATSIRNLLPKMSLFTRFSQVQFNELGVLLVVVVGVLSITFWKLFFYKTKWESVRKGGPEYLLLDKSQL